MKTLDRLTLAEIASDLGRERLWVFGKGRKERVFPLRGPLLTELRLYMSVDLPHVGRPPQVDDYLIYPVDRRAAGKGSEGQIVWGQYGRPKDRISGPALHRWWYRMAEEAGLVAPGSTSGLNMHRARHAFAQELRRVAGVEAASQALGHSDLSTTLGIYGTRTARTSSGRWTAMRRGSRRWTTPARAANRFSRRNCRTARVLGV